MLPPRPRRNRPIALALTLTLTVLAVACGGSEDSTAPTIITTANPSSSSTSTGGAPASTTTASTTTTTAPRALTVEQLQSALLRPTDVPHHLSPGDNTPAEPWVTEPPACGEALLGDGPGAVRAASSFVDPDGFLVYESSADHTPGRFEDFEGFRAAIAGPCSEGFAFATKGLETRQRYEPLADPDIGDDALAARFTIEYDLEGHPAALEGYLVYFRRGDVSVQVQLASGAVPSAGLIGPEVTLDEAVRVARRLEQRIGVL